MGTEPRGQKDRARIKRIAREAESRGEKEVRIAERFFIDGRNVYDIYVIKE
jgi:hypothetical protein